MTIFYSLKIMWRKISQPIKLSTNSLPHKPEWFEKFIQLLLVTTYETWLKSTETLTLTTETLFPGMGVNSPKTICFRMHTHFTIPALAGSKSQNLFLEFPTASLLSCLQLSPLCYITFQGFSEHLTIPNATSVKYNSSPCVVWCILHDP